MKHIEVKALIAAATLSGMAMHTMAQTSLPDTTLQKPIIARSVTAIATEPDPQIEIRTQSDMYPGMTNSFRIHVTGLLGASEVHLQEFKPGCGFELQQNVVGFGLAYIERSGRFDPLHDAPYSTIGDMSIPSRLNPPDEPDIRGRTVDATGVMEALQVRATAGISGNTSQTPENPALRPGRDSVRYVISVSGPFVECVPRAQVLWKDRATSAWRGIDAATNKPRDLKSGRFDLAFTRGKPWKILRPVRQTISNTEALSERSVAAIGSLVGTCSGRSETLAGSHPVGMRIEDGDITFTIRSGPLGTRCGFALRPMSLRNGVMLQDVQVTVSRVGSKCRLGSSAFLPSDVSTVLQGLILGGALNFSLDRITETLLPPVVIREAGAVQGVGVGSWVDPFTFPSAQKLMSWTTWSMPLVGVLECDVTGVNDHAVTLRVDSVNYSGPPGAKLF